MELESNLLPKVKKPPVGMPPTVRIVIEENDTIPPTGLFVGINGRSFMIRPGEEVDVPPGVLEILDNAVMSVPTVNATTRQVTGYRNKLRYPYRRVAKADA